MRVLSFSRLAATIFVLLLVTPALAQACAVCGGGSDRMRIAFLELSKLGR